MKKHLTVAIVEGDERSRNIVKLALARFSNGACVGSFSSPEAALRLLPQRPPAVLLIGVRPPLSSPLSALRLLKSALPGVKVVILSTLTDEFAILESLAAGADGYLVNPFSAGELALAIEAASNGGMPLSPIIARLLFARLRPRADSAAASLLTCREREVMFHVASGLADKEIASTLRLSLLTVKRHLHNIYFKLGVENRVQAINRAGPTAPPLNVER